MEEEEFDYDVYGTEEDEEFDYDEYDTEEEDSSDEMELAVKADYVEVLRTRHYCRELLWKDVRSKTARKREYSMELKYDAIEPAARFVAPRYQVKDLKTWRNKVTFRATPEEAFKFIWWAVGITRGGFNPAWQRDDDVIIAAVQGMDESARCDFVVVARLWLDKKVEDGLDLMSRDVNGLCSAHNLQYGQHLRILWKNEYGVVAHDYFAPHEFAALHYDMPRACYVLRLDDDEGIDYEGIVSQLRSELPQFRFWVSKRRRAVGIALRGRLQWKEDMRTPIFWALALINGRGVLEDGFGFPLSERQKRTVRMSFGETIDKYDVSDHTFMVGVR